jgi:hypothetical protein
VSWRPRSREDVTRLIVCAALMAGLILARALYLTHPFYPPSPVLDGIPQVSPPLDQVVLAALLACLAAAAVVPSRRAFIVGALVLMVALAAADQSRWQPWFYAYGLMLAALAALRTAGTRAGALDTCRAVVASLYVWSGLQKLNVTFVGTVFPWLVEPATTRLLPPRLAGWLPVAGVVVALLETGIGVGLLVRRSRDAAVVVAVAMHLAILLLLGPLGHRANAVVWPWNVAMALLVIVLFWRARDVRARDVLLPARLASAPIVVLVTVMPLLSFAGLWDAYLSGALYSGNVSEAVIVMSPAAKAALPPEIRRHVATNRAGADVLVIGDWSMAEVNAPPYPEDRVYRSLARHVCEHARPSAEATLVIFGKPHPWTGVRAETRHDCETLTRGSRARE